MGVLQDQNWEQLAYINGVFCVPTGFENYTQDLAAVLSSDRASSKYLYYIKIQLLHLLYKLKLSKHVITLVQNCQRMRPISSQKTQIFCCFKCAASDFYGMAVAAITSSRWMVLRRDPFIHSVCRSMQKIQHRHNGRYNPK